MREQLARADSYVDRVRQQQAREAASAEPALAKLDGPVKL
jgi:hypothetical protein